MVNNPRVRDSEIDNFLFLFELMDLLLSHVIPLLFVFEVSDLLATHFIFFHLSPIFEKTRSVLYKQRMNYVPE